MQRHEVEVMVGVLVDLCNVRAEQLQRAIHLLFSGCEILRTLRARGIRDNQIDAHCAAVEVFLEGLLKDETRVFARTPPPDDRSQ